jgi:putative ABC transport system ATP-binding protein
MNANDARPGPDSAVSCQTICKDFGDGAVRRRVLDSITLSISAGEMTLLVGPSGCGKTTLISIMAGVLTPSEGEVELYGTALYRLHPEDRVLFRLQNIGFIFQQFNLLPTLTAAENAGLPLAAAGLSRRAATRQGAAMLERLDMSALADRLPASLSGGQQQRVAIARALVHRPRLVVCDEPTSALDAQAGRNVMQVLRDVAVQAGRAVIVVTHDERVYRFGNRVLELEDGRIVRDRQGAEALGSPRLAQNA